MNEHILILQGYIEHLEYMKKNADDFFDRKQADENIEAFKAAIKALEQEPCPNAISRSDMLDAIGHGTTYTSEELQKIIKGLPPVKPQPKTGHWIFDEILDKHYYCSECKSMGVDYWDFCPSCGAKMVEPQERSGEE